MLCGCVVLMEESLAAYFVYMNTVSNNHYLCFGIDQSMFSWF